MAYGDYYGYEFAPYVSVAARRAKATRELARLQKKGRALTPVAIDGRKIALTFWGKAWCDNLERYSDFSNRLPRGRSYVRNGSVVDLQVGAGRVTALVSGSSLYEVNVTVEAVPHARWAGVCQDCSGAIDSLVELLQGRLSKAVMARLCQENTGLFPSPKEISFTCSCPDWASMCKHVAAVLYGIGARLDRQPELLFALRKVDQRDLIARAGSGLPTSKKQASGKVLESDDLSGMFGIEMAPEAPQPRRLKPAKTGTSAAKSTRAKAPKSKQPQSKQPQSKQSASTKVQSRKAAPTRGDSGATGDRLRSTKVALKARVPAPQHGSGRIRGVGRRK
jgi:uncharacterized Zn finger protein